MIEAFKKINKLNNDINLVFYGDGPDMQIIKDLVSKYNLDKFVIFAGKVDNIHEVVSKSKVYVLTSDYEGIPNSLIEAMSSGVPVVSTDCSPGGAKLLIKHKVNGLLVPVGDVNKIADSVMEILNNPSTAERYAKEATKISEEFSPDKIIRKWEELIKKVLSDSLC